MDAQYILAIDQGTHATRAILFDAVGNAGFTQSVNVNLTRTKEGFVEQDGSDILESSKQVITSALGYCDTHGIQPFSAGLCTQRSSVIAWDRQTGEPLAPIISWQDTRAEGLVNSLGPHQSEIRKRTGLRLSAHYGASKMAWLLDNCPAVQRAASVGRLAVTPLVSYLLFHLLEGQPYVVDHANATRTQLFNLETQNWDPWLLTLFGLETLGLPICRPTQDQYGLIKNTRIPLTAVNGDQTAALYQHGKPDSGTFYINLGTGGFVMATSEDKYSADPMLLSHIANSRGQDCELVVEGTVNGAGAALDWVVDNMGLPPENSANSISNPDDSPLFINSVGGLGSPWWRAELTPRFVSVGADNADYAASHYRYAVLESISFLLQANIDRFLGTGVSATRIVISGGLSNNDSLCQLIADLSRLPVERSSQTEGSARGIAWLAGASSLNWNAAFSKTFISQTNIPLLQRYLRFGSEMARLSRDLQPGILVAHRGDMEQLPENSLTAIESALAAGARFIEVDVQLSADEIPCLFHDQDLERITGSTGLITELRSDQLAELSAHEPTRLGDRHLGTPIATLDQAMALIDRYPSVTCFIELKRQSIESFGVEKSVDAVIRCLEKAKSRHVLISFQADALIYARKVHNIPVGWIIRDYDQPSLAQATEMLPEFLFCNATKLTDPDRAFGSDPWCWVLYECNGWDQILDWIRVGAGLVETARIGHLIRQLSQKPDTNIYG